MGIMNQIRAGKFAKLIMREVILGCGSGTPRIICENCGEG